MTSSPLYNRGFTLVEIAIVLLIVALLLGGLLMPLSAQIDGQRASETQKNLAEIRDALLGFTVVNGRLPCPALATIATGTAGAGLEPTPVAAAGCANTAGVLPWATLGVNETDAWGNRYTYRVTVEFTRTINQTTFAVGCTPSSNPQYSAFALCSKGDINVKSSSGGTALASNVPVIVISHGKNGNGAFTTLGIKLSAGSDTDEIQNQLNATGTGTTSNDFVSKTTTPTYDDIVVWLSPNILYNRMIAAGKLP